MKLILFVLCLSCVGCGSKAETKSNVPVSYPPWTVVCDKQGHYALTWSDGSIDRPQGVYSTQAAAFKDLVKIKAIYEAAVAVGGLYDKEEKAVDAIKGWQVCNETEAQAVAPLAKYIQQMNTPNYLVLKPALPLPGGMTISAGTGRIIISYADGTVKLEDISLDEASRQFWFQVAKAFPEARAAIIAGEKGKP